VKSVIERVKEIIDEDRVELTDISVSIDPSPVSDPYGKEYKHHPGGDFSRGCSQVAVCWSHARIGFINHLALVHHGSITGAGQYRDRITVYDVLEYLASRMTQEQILADFPDLESEDIQACLAYAADREREFVSVPPAYSSSSSRSFIVHVS
jgi:uncharacterized protein (DUF433 family)